MATALKNLSEVIGNIPSGKGKKFAIVVSEWNHNVTFALMDGAKQALIDNGSSESDIEIYFVPGCFELALAAQHTALTTKPDAVICLGCIIKGDTPHFDYVSQGTTQGIMSAGLNTGIPTIFGVLTVDNLQQALDRAGGKHGNKGTEAGLTALKMTQYR